MNIHDALERALGALSEKLAEGSMEHARRHARRLGEKADELGLAEPCQELYDAFVRDDRVSAQVGWWNARIAGAVDAAAGTGAVGPDGLLYNEPELPTAADARSALESHGLPADGMGVWEVIALALDALAAVGLSGSTRGQYLLAWRELAGHLALTRGSTAYDAAAVAELAEATSARDDRSGRTIGARLRALEVIGEVGRTGGCEWAVVRAPLATRGPGEEVRRLYMDDARSRNLSGETLKTLDRAMRRLVEASGLETPEELSGLTAAHVDAAVSLMAETCSARSMGTMVPALRDALRFLAEAGVCDASLALRPGTPALVRDGVVGYLSAEDEATLVRSLSGASLRDRAIVLVGLRLGLRDSDVRGLRLDQVDWSRDEIRLVQRKTGRPLRLPLTAEVGNAIMDYVLRERPEGARGCPYVFVRSRAPHTGLGTLYDICSRAIARAGVEPVGGGSRGMHLLRRTHARRMLESGATYETIGDALGHATPESNRPYVALDEAGLAACALGLDGIGVPSWCAEGAGSDE